MKNLDLNKTISETISEYPELKKTDGKAHRQYLLQSYVKRLSAGESLETVRREFTENFADVDAAEIAKAEQSLITGGTPVSDVQKLCDVHSALFHGATRKERIAQAEKAVSDSAVKGEAKGLYSAPVSQEETRVLHAVNGRKVKAEALIGETGHPLQILSLENEAISAELTRLSGLLDEGFLQGDAARDSESDRDALRNLAAGVSVLETVSDHYAKKGDLLYPVLKAQYDYSGPADVMWGVDGEIRSEIHAAAKLLAASDAQEAAGDRLKKVLTRAQEMIYKEQNILYPLCAELFSERDWQMIYAALRDYEPCMIGSYPVWKKSDEAMQHYKGLAGTNSAAASGSAERCPAPRDTAKQNGMPQDRADEESDIESEKEIRLPTGHLTLRQLQAIFSTIPMELTFVDDKNINRYFNSIRETKLFKRPLNALDREVFACHPPKAEPLVRGIIASFRSGEQDSAKVWINKKGSVALVRYLAVRGDDGAYLGTLECVERMDSARDYFQN